MRELESLIQPEEDYVTAIVRTLIASVGSVEGVPPGEPRPSLSLLGGISSHGKTYQSHGVSSEGDER